MKRCFVYEVRLILFRYAMRYNIDDMFRVLQSNAYLRVASDWVKFFCVLYLCAYDASMLEANIYIPQTIEFQKIVYILCWW